MCTRTSRRVRAAEGEEEGRRGVPQHMCCPAADPIVNGTVTRRSLVDPTAPVHVLTGAAGPPGSPEDFSQPASFTRR